MTGEKKVRLALALAVGLVLGGGPWAGRSPEAYPFGAIRRAEAASGIVDPSIRPVALYERLFFYEAWGRDVMAFHQSWPELFLPEGDEAARAGLAAGLRLYSREAYQNVMASRDRGREAALEAMQDTPDIFRTYRDDGALILRRADSLAVSFVVTKDDYTGGRYEFVTWHGVNLDATTGKRLLLSDVFADKAGLAEAIAARLRADYLDVPFEEMEASVKRLVDEEKINWTLGPRGASFCLNPFEAARLSAGILEATILFDELPHLFRDDYRRGPAAYCEAIPVNSQTEISLLDGSGRRDKLLVFTREPEEKGMAGMGKQRLRIVLNDARYEDPEPAVAVAPVHVHTEDGRNYLYVDCADAVTGEREIRAYDLGGDAPRFIGKTPHTFDRTVRGEGEHYRRRWLMTDPDRFLIDDNDNVWNRNAKTHAASVGADGQIAFG